MDITAGNCLYWAGYPVVEDGEIVWDIEETREYYEWYKEFYKREGGIGNTILETSGEQLKCGIRSAFLKTVH